MNRVSELENYLRTNQIEGIEGDELKIRLRNENIDLTEENSRLMKHIETLNRRLESSETNCSDAKAQFMKRELEIKRGFEEFEAKNNELRLLKEEVYTLRNDNKRYLEGSKQLNSMNFDLEKKNKEIYDLEKKLNNKEIEYDNLKRSYEDLKIVHQTEKKEMENEISKRNAIIDSNKKIYIDKMNEKLTEIIELKKERSGKLTTKVETALQNLEVNTSNSPQSIIIELIKKLRGVNKKLANLENESKIIDPIKSNRSKYLNKETLDLIEELGKEFTGAHGELNVCQKYLEKKGTEIKELKKEIYRLQRVK